MSFALDLFAMIASAHVKTPRKIPLRFIKIILKAIQLLFSHEDPFYKLDVYCARRLTDA